MIICCESLLTINKKFIEIKEEYHSMNRTNVVSAIKKAGAVFAAACILTACGGKDAAASIDGAALAKSLATDIKYDDKLSELSSDEISGFMDVADGAEGVMYMGSGSTAEEVAVFTCDSEETAEAQKANVETFLADQKTQFDAYNPDEVARIDDAVLKQEGTAVILCVSGDPDKAESIVEEAAK